ncbi:MAG TPA: hypothetical protein VJ600_02760 [Holophagaceae bacterium]|nr:hypothetical protein [Holophagaceae bacterium]
MGACDREQGAPATPAAQQQGPAAEPGQGADAAKEAAAKGVPYLPVSGPSIVTAGAPGLQASVEAREDLTYHWSADGATITDGQESAQITFTAGTSDFVTLYCKITDPLKRETTSRLQVPCMAPPRIDLFEAVPPAVSLGHQTQLRWSAGEIKTLMLDPGAQDVSKVGGVNVKPQVTTTYTLTATNLAGAELRKEFTVKVVPLPTIARFQLEGAVLFDQVGTVVAEFAHGKAEIKQGETVLASGSDSPIRVPFKPSEASVLTLSVTNEAGDVVAQTLSFRPATRN